MIEIRNLSKSYNDITPVNDLSLVINIGSRTAILGPSGCGKTTLLRIIAGLLPPDSGEIIIGGKVVFDKKTNIHPSKRDLGFVFQWPSLWPHMTVFQNIAYGLGGMKKADKIKKVSSFSDVFEISDILAKYPDEISGGQAKRVSLARTLIVNPQYVLLDEPLANIDENLKTKILKILADIVSKNGSTLIYVSHDKNELESICNEFYRFENGKIKRCRDV